MKYLLLSFAAALAAFAITAGASVPSHQPGANPDDGASVLAKKGGNRGHAPKAPKAPKGKA